ncbi:MAG: succinate dehydrogenase assembly factor 4 [Terricaulis sp.]
MADEVQPPRKLTPEAQRALAEADERRAAAAEEKAKEVGGPSGPEPTRYGDWERKGIASDF